MKNFLAHKPFVKMWTEYGCKYIFEFNHVFHFWLDLYMTRQMQYIITLVLKSSRTITSLATYLYRTPSPTVLTGKMTKHHRQKHNRGHLFSKIIKKRISPISVFLRKNFSLKKNSLQSDLMLFLPSSKYACNETSQNWQQQQKSFLI